MLQPPSSIWERNLDHPVQGPIPPQAPINVTIQVFRKRLADGSTAAVAFNRGEVPMSVTFTAPMLSLSQAEAKAGQIRDLWQHKEMGAFGASGYKATVGKHDVVAIRVTQK